ncbi:peptide deformylase [Rhizobium sp. SL86]|uniref:peptide deformylase n=1 Tax=Rhizobium sp. SL86 TaxID=2995148 RepID=UPI0022727752|nr:peptide deformylase [Rhizobium sp. SL86]MCY1668689.1 peptide deformylase [Rhizobium sp. SL86]
MTIRPILRYPDPRLLEPCQPVVMFDNTLQDLCDDLLQTMRAAPGVGITAAHVGELVRVSVIQLAPDEPLLIHINPHIISASTELQRFTEGSVSMPGFTEEVERPARIRFGFQDLSGTAHEGEAEGFLATCIQHEIDQLDGLFWLKRLSRLKRDRLIKKWEKHTR